MFGRRRKWRNVLVYSEGMVDPEDIARAWKGPMIPVLGDPKDHVMVLSSDGPVQMLTADGETAVITKEAA